MIGTSKIGVAASRGSGGVSAGLVTDGLILNLDSTDTDSYPESGTSWDDLSGESNDFTLYNSPTFSADNGGTIVTDGTNDYIQSDSAIDQVNKPMSAFAYVKITNLTANSSGGLYATYIFNKRTHHTTSGHWQITIVTSASDWTANGFMSPKVAVFNGGNTKVSEVDGNSVASPPEIRNDEWHYIGFTTDGTSGGDLNLYVDGVLCGTSTLSADRGVASTAVRTSMTGWGSFFGLVGSNRNFHIYDKKITAEEVLQNYNAIKV